MQQRPDVPVEQLSRVGMPAARRMPEHELHHAHSKSRQAGLHMHQLPARQRNRHVLQEHLQSCRVWRLRIDAVRGQLQQCIMREQRLLVELELWGLL